MSRSWLVGVVGSLSLGLVGCGSADDFGRSAGAGEETGETRDEVTKKCGVDKYAGPQGADVSVWQGDFDWSTAGVTFGYARISDGMNHIDPEFEGNWAEMKQLGILRGAYQYFEPAQSAQAQAEMMVQKVGGKLGPGDMPCMIDVEATGGQSPATIASKVKTWLDIVEAGTGKRPIIYTGSYFWQDNVQDTSFGAYPIWIAAYGPSCPSLPPGWDNWLFWQYCNGDTQYCTNGKGWDRNVFNGTQQELDAFAGGNAAEHYGAEFVAQSFPYAVEALVMKAGETIPASITLKNTGTKAWDANTRLGTTEPRDRASVFADDTWIGPNRPAGVSGSVAPGETYEFQFNLRAPAEPGTYYEYFGVLEEGVTWFSDPGQAGPPDNQLQAQIQVVPGDNPVGTGGGSGSGWGTGGSGIGGSGSKSGNQGEKTGVEADVEGSCSTSLGPSANAPTWVWLAGLGLFLSTRMRRRRR
jgi:lysozyme